MNQREKRIRELYDWAELENKQLFDHIISGARELFPFVSDKTLRTYVKAVMSIQRKRYVLFESDRHLTLHRSTCHKVRGLSFDESTRFNRYVIAVDYGVNLSEEKDKPFRLCGLCKPTKLKV